jgi:putative copper resistance protein D
VSHWSPDWLVIVAYLALAGLHLVRLRRVRGDQGGGAAGSPAGLAREAVAFQAGLLVVVLALVSPVSYWAGVFISVRALQDLMLGIFAPPLIVLGAPWLVFARPRRHRAASDQARDGAPARAGAPGPAQWWAGAARWLSERPVAVVVTFNIVWLGWHLPTMYNLVQTSALARSVAYVTYLGAGVLFWLQLIGSRPYAPRAAPLRRVALLVATFTLNSLFGMVLVFGSKVLYTAYSSASDHGLRLLSDQQLAGAELWTVVIVPFLIAAVALFSRWLDEEDSVSVSSGLDKVLRPGTSSWPSRPGFR